MSSICLIKNKKVSTVPRGIFETVLEIDNYIQEALKINKRHDREKGKIYKLYNINNINKKDNIKK